MSRLGGGSVGMVRIGRGYGIVPFSRLLIHIQVERILDGRRIVDAGPDVVERLATVPFPVGGEQGVAHRQDADEAEVDVQFGRHLQVQVHLGVEAVVVGGIADGVDVTLVHEADVAAVQDIVAAAPYRDISLVIVPRVLQHQALIVHVGIDPVHVILPGISGEGLLGETDRIAGGLAGLVVQADVFLAADPFGHDVDHVDAPFIAGIDFPRVVQAAERPDVDRAASHLGAEAGLVHDIGDDGDRLDFFRIEGQGGERRDGDVIHDDDLGREAPDVEIAVGLAVQDAGRTGVLRDEKPRDHAGHRVLDVSAGVFLNRLPGPGTGCTRSLEPRPGPADGQIQFLSLQAVGYRCVRAPLRPQERSRKKRRGDGQQQDIQ